ncbi:MAG: exosortase A [Novosphingobium sp.]
MLREALHRSKPISDGWSGLTRAWRVSLAALAAAWLALVLIFARDWLAMADQWWNTSTYTHVLLIPPIIVWLVWQRWPQLQQLEPQGWWPGLLTFAGALLLWVMGAFAGINLARQLGAVIVLAAATLTLLGPKAGRALAFPLFYMLFLVPFGDELVPPLQILTAKLTVALVQLTGVSATIDGVFINTPAGLFEVAAACSGVKFLIAMTAFGVLACHLCFRTWHRRALFMLLCLVAPILANGVRAWGTVYIAQYIGAAAAGGFDHIIYGWIFFALVITTVIAIGWKFFDREAGAPMADVAQIEASPLLARLADYCIAPRTALAIMAALLIVAQAWFQVAATMTAKLPSQAFLPEVAGWHRVNYTPATWWEPRARGADHRLLGRYSDGYGLFVDVFFALYSSQSEGREAGGYGQGALMPESAWQWQSPGPDSADTQSDRLLSNSAVERLAQTSYRTGNVLTGSNSRLRIANLADRILLHPEPTMVLIVSAEKVHGNQPAMAIAAFRKSVGPLGPWMDHIAGLR